MHTALIALIEDDVLAVCKQVNHHAHQAIRFVHQKSLLMLKKVFPLRLTLVLVFTEQQQTLHLQHLHAVDNSGQYI